MLALIAIAVLAPLLYIPGFLLERALRGTDYSPDILERHYERVVLGALVCGWLALTLAELGVFSNWLFLLLLVLMCALALWLGRPTISKQPPATDHQQTATNDQRTLHGMLRRHWEIAAFLVIGLLLLVLVARPFEVVLGVRDAGVYANTGFAIAHHGGILQHDAIVAQIGEDKGASDETLAAAAEQAETNFLSNQDRTRNINTGVRTAGFFFIRELIDLGQIIPQGFHLFPAWIAVLTSLLGMQGGLLATGLMGVLGVWSAGMLGRRIGGPWVGVLAALLLALNGVQVWFSRYSTTETTAQFLTLAGMWGFAAMNTRMVNGERSPSTVPALIAGLAFGQWALVRIEFLLVVGPVLAYLVYMWLSQRWNRSHTVLAPALGAMLVQAALHITLIARGYFFDTLWARLQDKSAIVAALTLPFLNDTLREVYLTTPRSLINYYAENPADRHSPLRLVFEVLALIVVIIGLVALRRWASPLRAFEAIVRRLARPLLNMSALILVLLLGYAYVIRPQILSPAVLAAAPTCLAPNQIRQPSGACLALQGYIGAPITPPTRPDVFAYWLDTLPKLLRQPGLATIAEAAPALITPVRDLPTLEGLPSPGVTLDQLNVRESAQVLGTSSDALSLLVRTPRGVTGWIDVGALALDAATLATMPSQDDRILARVVNPRWATTLSPGNPSEAAKFAIYQASFVRFGWYLSPLGIVLAAVGLALLWRRMNQATWLLLIVGSATTYFFIEQAYGTDEATYIYLLRRFVPLVYPLFCLSIAFALVALARQWTVDGGRKQTILALIFRGSTFVFVTMLLGFLVATNFKLYRHTEYAGALEQIEQIASQFEPDDVLLLRGGAPTYASFRDLPDNLATPLIYAFDRNALTVKSPNPGNYAADLARYVRRWQEQGRDVYLLLSASGGMALPGFWQQKLESVALQLPEFEQLTNQKPSNVQTLTADYTIYKLVPGEATSPQTTFAPNDYAPQLRGFYRPEQFAGETLAWTDGAALLRLPWPKTNAPFTLTLTLAPGKRPTSLGATQVRLSYRAETKFNLNEQLAQSFSPPQSFPLAQGTNEVTLTINPATMSAPPTGTFLLQIESDTWIPARDDPGSNDDRALGVLYGGLRIESR